MREREKWQKEIKGRMKVRETAFDGQAKGKETERKGKNNKAQNEKGKWHGLMNAGLWRH